MNLDPVQSGSIISRAKAILLKPKEEWPVIASETTPSGDIFTRYVIPLALIGPVCAFIGAQLFGYGVLGVRYRPPLMASLSSAIVSFIAALAGVLIVAFIANKLAPKFGGRESTRDAFKLVAYAMTASFVAGVFNILPALAILGLLGLYSLYLFYTGAQPLMQVPADKAIGYTAVTAICAILIGIVAAAIAGAVGASLMGPNLGSISAASGAGDDATITLPGGGTIDTGKLAEAARSMEQAAQAAQAGTGKTVAPADLQALLPPSIGSYARTAVESMQAGPAGSRAEGTYERDGKRFTLSIADMSAMGAMAALGAAMGVESSREDADGYERTTNRDGNMLVEKWRNSGDGSYGAMIGNRFFVEAEGAVESIDELKAAVAGIDQRRLLALAQ